MTNFDAAPVDKVAIVRGLPQRFTLDTFNDGVYTAGRDARFTLLGGGQTLVGDWDGDGYDDIGLFRPLTGTFLLFVNGHLFKTVTRLDGRHGGIPLVGNWDGLPGDELGLFRPPTGKFILDIDGDGVSNDADDRVGSKLDGRAYGKPLVGDWDGDRRGGSRPVPPGDRGLHARQGSGPRVPGRATTRSSRGLAGRVGGQALVGDWDGDGDDDVGLFFGSDRPVAVGHEPQPTGGRDHLHEARRRGGWPASGRGFQWRRGHRLRAVPPGHGQVDDRPEPQRQVRRGRRSAVPGGGRLLTASRWSANGNSRDRKGRPA